MSKELFNALHQTPSDIEGATLRDRVKTWFEACHLDSNYVCPSTQDFAHYIIGASINQATYPLFMSQQDADLLMEIARRARDTYIALCQENQTQALLISTLQSAWERKGGEAVPVAAAAPEAMPAPVQVQEFELDQEQQRQIQAMIQAQQRRMEAEAQQRLTFVNQPQVYQTINNPNPEGVL